MEQSFGSDGDRVDHDLLEGGERREARDIIAELVRASASVRARHPRPRWYHRFMGIEVAPAEAMLIMTAAGQVGAHMTEGGACILRCRGDANVNRHLRSVLPEQRKWDELERAWTIPGEAIEEAFVSIISARRAVEHVPTESGGASSDEHAEEELLLLPATAIVMNSRYGMMSGQQQGNVIEMMVLEPRMQQDLKAGNELGLYRQDSLIGLWTIPSVDFEAATAWAGNVSGNSVPKASD